MDLQNMGEIVTFLGIMKIDLEKIVAQEIINFANIKIIWMANINLWHIKERVV